MGNTKQTFTLIVCRSLEMLLDLNKFSVLDIKKGLLQNKATVTKTVEKPMYQGRRATICPCKAKYKSSPSGLL
jgi:hypothetical protein